MAFRIRVDNTTPTPDDYYYWGGEWEIRPTYSGFGTLTESVLPIITMTPAQFDTFKEWNDAQITARLEDIAAAVNG